jgi:hypothetical protein
MTAPEVVPDIVMLSPFDPPTPETPGIDGKVTACEAPLRVTGALEREANARFEAGTAVAEAVAAVPPLGEGTLAFPAQATASATAASGTSARTARVMRRIK